MDIDQHLKTLEANNKALFSAKDTWILASLLSAIAITLALSIEHGAAALITGISAFFILYFYVDNAIKKVNARITLLETKYLHNNKHR